MRRFLDDWGEDMLSFGAIVLVLVCLIGGVILFEMKTCDAKGAAMETPARWGLWEGV